MDATGAPSVARCPECRTPRPSGMLGRRPCNCTGSIIPGSHLAFRCGTCRAETTISCEYAPAPPPTWDPVHDADFFRVLEGEFADAYT